MDYTVAMQRAITLSEEGLGKTSPNPIVGTVIIDDAGNVIGEGFHDRMNSKDHAEVVAITNATQSGNKIKGATIVVTLEPCNHAGITGPCTQAIIDAGISTVVFAVSDPNSVASGGGEVLRAAGIKVVEGVLKAEAAYANRAWLMKIKKNRPFFTWKVATTLDAKIAATDGTSKWITNETSRADVQILRRRADAILVGTNTVITDDPHLIPRGDFAGYSHNPIRVICGEQDLPADAKVFDSAAQTVVVKSKDLDLLVEKLNKLEINQVFVEAGMTLASAMVDHCLMDELVIYQAPSLLGSGKPFFTFDYPSTISNQMRLDHISTVVLDGDVKSVYRIRNGE
ncbi:MAG: bifunctional diaminohydroxyphosphoribosylaminopyrimidine deaminase/5-amino-6-(5-phosphoribosylamino)uracil reductase RibD [Candidatus Nanopelagicaceae bacterium]|nr:bifunctional diaminohydroxyphosphoribosylaminopyrimidine deaminase/5-amino-6-(5-phosphoribosylamino)uracil reductase RibD [Candidatus Nanopelagicaceae bacterium]